MQYDPMTGETPSPEDRRRDPWSSSPQSPMHGQPGQGWQPGQQPGATDPRMPGYPAGQHGDTTGPVPPGYGSDQGGRGYDYGDQPGMPPGRSVFDVPSTSGEFGLSAPTGEYAVPPTGEYAQPNWQQPPAWTGSDPLARVEAPPGGWSASPAGGWDTGQQQPYAGPPTQAWQTGEQQAWQTGEQQAWQTGEQQAASWQTGERPALGYERGAAQDQDYGQGYGGSGYVQDYGSGSGYGRDDQDYGQAFGSPQGQEYGGAGQGYGQGYGREDSSPPYEQTGFGQAGDLRNGYANGYGQAGLAGDAQQAGTAYQGYDTGGDRFGQPDQPADMWGEGSGYGATDLNGGVATQVGASRTDAFSPGWSAAGGWAHAQPAGAVGADQPYFGGPAEPGRAEQSNGLALGALIAALVGLVIPIVPAIVALILAAKASRRIAESAGAVGGRGMVVASRAIAGVTLVLGAIGIVIAAMILPSLRNEVGSQGAGGGVYGSGGAPSSEPTQKSTPTEPGTARIVSLNIGDCIANTPKNQVTNVKVVSCAAKHETEVFANVKIDNASLPSEQALDSLAKKRCVSAFNSYVGKNYNDSVLNIRYFTPTEDSWAAGDRAVTCTLTSGTPGGKLTGSKKGTAE